MTKKGGTDSAVNYILSCSVASQWSNPLAATLQLEVALALSVVCYRRGNAANRRLERGVMSVESKDLAIEGAVTRPGCALV